MYLEHKLNFLAIVMFSLEIFSTYEERLKATGMTSLEERRTRGDAIETFKTLRGINRVERDSWFVVREEEETVKNTRSNTMIVGGEEVRRREVVVTERARLEVRRHSFTVRAGRLWNDLPEEVKAQKTVNAFKNQFDKWQKKQIIRQEIQDEASDAPQRRDDEPVQA